MNQEALFDSDGLQRQLDLQLQHEFDVDTSIPWQHPICTDRYFLPLDEHAIAFPGAHPRQRKTISQFIGLVINHTIAEMEEVAEKLRHVAWKQTLDSYPINPEMYALGEQFFAEERKHAMMFRRFYSKFCQQSGIDEQSLSQLMPSAYGSAFQHAIRKNAEGGGHAFWWVVALVEEVSVWIYQQLYRSRKEICPIYYAVQRRHFEEESRHTNYAFLMLELIRRRNLRQGRKIRLKTDLLYSELFSTAWVLCELEKVFKAEQLQNQHPFFADLAECLPLLRKMSPIQLAQQMFVGAPYVSSVLNPRFHRLTPATASQHAAWMLPYPQPKKIKTFVTVEDVWSEAS